MSTSQALRYERRRQRELHERQEIRETVAGILAIVLILTAFALAGTMDYHDQQVYEQSWHQIHGVD